MAMSMDGKEQGHKMDTSQEVEPIADHGPYEFFNLYQPELQGDTGGVEISGQTVHRASELDVHPNKT